MIYQYLVSRANYKTHETLAVGQTIIILSEIESETGWSRRMIKFSLDRLADQGYIHHETLKQKRGVLVTISCYDDFQKLENYKKNSPKNVQENVQENEQPMYKESTSNVHENVHENEAQKPYEISESEGSENEDVQENEHQMYKQCTTDEQENVQENEQLISITAFITSFNSNNINNINNNRTIKQYLDSANVKSMNLTSVHDVEIFVDFALRINALPSGVSRKILISYIECIRLTRQTCTISANVLANLFEKFGKYSVNQINYAMWLHVLDHDDKKEKYTLGILRNIKEPEAMRGLIKLKNRNGGMDIASGQSSNEPKYDYGF